MTMFRRIVALFGAVTIASCAPVLQSQTAAPAPASAPVARPVAGQAFVTAAHPMAVQAGLAVLRRGGDAVDAAVAVQTMLGLVEPQSSGLGGGAFMLRYDAGTREIAVYDGREVAPAGATPDMFMGADGKPIGFRDAVLSGRATGVPGAVAMLHLAHQRHGTLAWKDLFGASIDAAAQGFPVSPRLGRFASGSSPQVGTADARRYFTKADGTRVRTGEALRNPAYADFVRRLAAQGPDALYRGETARRIVAKLREGALAGSMTEADLAAYRPVVRQALCGPYRDATLCVPPPPSSGVGLLQLMAMLDRTDIATRGPRDPVAWVQFAEASRLMYADRDAYVGDTRDVPVRGLLDPAYVASRARLIGNVAGAAPEPGTPPGAIAARIDATVEAAGTSHFVIVDARGNAVSMTTTVESIFGSGRMVDGFFLNNQMTDFSFVPEGPNAIAPGKRPRSSMAPTIILDKDRALIGAIGSPGGNSILAYNAKALLGILGWGLSVPDAIALPNLIARGASFGGEVDKFAPAVRSGLPLRGVDLRPGQGEDSGLHGVMIRDGRFDGGADPRRDGAASTTIVEPRR